MGIKKITYLIVRGVKAHGEAASVEAHQRANRMTSRASSCLPTTCATKTEGAECLIQGIVDVVPCRLLNVMPFAVGTPAVPVPSTTNYFASTKH